MTAPVYFLDASAVIKVYIEEKGSDTVHAAFRRLDGLLYISDLVAVETMASFARLWRKKQISTRAYRTVRNGFLGDLGTRFFVLPLPGFVYDATLAALHTLRDRGIGAADTLHICTAEWLQSLVPGEPISFMCSDEKLRKAASSRGSRSSIPRSTRSPGSPRPGRRPPDLAKCGGFHSEKSCLHASWRETFV